MIILALSSSRCITSAIVFVRIRHMNIRELNNPLMRQNIMIALHVSTACQGLLEAPASRSDVDEGNTPDRKSLVPQTVDTPADERICASPARLGHPLLGCCCQLSLVSRSRDCSDSGGMILVARSIPICAHLDQRLAKTSTHIPRVYF